MRRLVDAEIAAAEKCLAARLADKGPLTRVFASVLHKICLKAESVLAKLTLKRLLTCVNSLVPFKLQLQLKLLTTVCTRQCVLVILVNHHMSLEAAHVAESLTTNTTHVWSLPGMHSHVIGQFLSSVEVFITFTANQAFLYSHVYLKLFHSIKCIIAAHFSAAIFPICA